ncbi:hypothetical protein [Escherichia phage Henu7]|uniref:Uncharacterized protein n=1 Tax=Escherichia phage Henu7 TaxID=2589652 RepID=A0A5B8RNN5_9CAUD|nr:hypothetical protein KMB86_gp24 [Escherichia phage Henu7]QEA09678.1 hypothetical protein [Escherichia phage Henu7]
MSNEKIDQLVDEIIETHDYAGFNSIFMIYPDECGVTESELKEAVEQVESVLRTDNPDDEIFSSLTACDGGGVFALSFINANTILTV